VSPGCFGRTHLSWHSAVRMSAHGHLIRRACRFVPATWVSAGPAGIAVTASHLRSVLRSLVRPKSGQLPSRPGLTLKRQRWGRDSSGGEPTASLSGCLRQAPACWRTGQRPHQCLVSDRERPLYSAETGTDLARYWLCGLFVPKARLPLRPADFCPIGTQRAPSGSFRGRDRASQLSIASGST